MTKKFEDGENQKSFSEGDVSKAQDLIKKMREIIGWDLGALCSTSEEVGMVKEAESAMKDIQTFFHVPEKKFWADFPGKDMADSMHQVDKHDHQILPNEIIVLSPNDLKKVRAGLGALEEVLGWDISAHDERELAMIRDAQESLVELKAML